MRASAQRSADILDAGRAAAMDRLAHRIEPDLEAGANDLLRLPHIVPRLAFRYPPRAVVRWLNRRQAGQVPLRRRAGGREAEATVEIAVQERCHAVDLAVELLRHPRPGADPALGQILPN